MRESAIERYLVKRVKAAGGECRKLKGRRNEPDRLVLWPGTYGPARAHFVETKAPGKRPRPGQVREHTRLGGMGFSVFVISTKEAVDNYVKDWR